MDIRQTIKSICGESNIEKYANEYNIYINSSGKKGLSLKKIELEHYRTPEYRQSISDIPHVSGDIINIFMLCRDNQENIRKTLNTLFSMEDENPRYIFYYWVFENDSTDKTKEILKSMLDGKNGMLCTGVLNTRKWNTIRDINRAKDMARYRKLNRFMCEFKGVSHMDTADLSGMFDVWDGTPTGLDGSDFSIIVDTGVKFSTDIFKMMMNSLENKDIGMVVPFGHIKGNENRYYDTYALCQTKNKINSAFGGFAMVRSKLFKVCDWGVHLPTSSEHNTFCYDIIKYGYSIKLDRKIKVEWQP